MGPVLVLAALLSQVVSPGGAPQPLIVSADYHLGPGDVMSIQVSGVRGFDSSARVTNSGRIHVPYVGIMYAAGKTSIELELEIAKAIREHELVNEPAVRVQIVEYKSQPTYVIGHVQFPGQFILSGEMYLLDLLSKAGGVLQTGGDTALLYRRNAPRPMVETRILPPNSPRSEPGTQSSTQPTTGSTQHGIEPMDEVIQVDLNALRYGTKPELNVPVRGGDILYVPRRRTDNIFIIGDVRVPGGYVLPPGSTITAAQAVIYAGGPMPTARMKSAFLMRHDETGMRQAIPVDFNAIIEGRQPDIPIRPNDIIFIPNSGAKTVGLALFNMLPRLLQQFLIF